MLLGLRPSARPAVSRARPAPTTARHLRHLRLRCDAKDKTTSGRKNGKPRDDKPDGSGLDAYWRSNPLFSRFYDTTLIFGDAVMILATQFSSERIDFGDALTYSGVLIFSWICTGAWLGDYKGGAPVADSFYVSMLGPSFTAIINSTLTWAFSTTASLAVLSALVANGVINAVPLVQDLNTENTSPQLEVLVAMLVTMLCWRGIAARLRS